MVLVTGATGILGRVIVLELLKKGYSVRATKQKTSDLEEVRQSFRYYTDNSDEIFSKIHWVEVDFQDLESLEMALSGVREVYHCAGKVSFDPRDRDKIYKTNVEGTKNLLYVCQDSSVEKFLFVSSVASLDGINEKGQIDEDSEFNSKIEQSFYAKSKYFSEMEVWRAHAEGLATIIINPATIIGSGNWGRSSGMLVDTFKNQDKTYSGGTAYVDVRDVAEIAIRLMEQNAFGKRFVISSENKTFEEIGNLIRTKLGLGKVKILPDNILHFTQYLRILSFLFPKLRMINKANIRAVTTHTPISNQRIKEFLGHYFISVEESLDFHIKNYLQK